MANNPGTIQVGDWIHYLNPPPGGETDPELIRRAIRWRAAKVTTVVSQISLNLAIVEKNGTRTPINGGVPVAKRTSATQLNVWRRFK